MIKDMYESGTFYKMIEFDPEDTENARSILTDAWEDRDLIAFESIHGRMIFIMGIESLSDNYEEDVFVKLEEFSGHAESLIGDMDELMDYLKYHNVDYIGLEEVK